MGIHPRYVLPAAILALTGWAAGAANLAVLRIGDDSFHSGSAAAPISIDYFDTAAANQASPQSTLSIPSSGSNALVLSGAHYEGGLVTAPNGALVFAGYRATAGTNFIVGSTSLAAPRAIATLQGSTYALNASFGIQMPNADYSSSAMHGGMTDDNGHFWGAGSSKGTILANGGNGNNVIIQSSLVNTRMLGIFDDNLYFSTISSFNTRGIHSLGAPASALAPVTPTLVIPTGSGSSPVEFAFNPDQTIAYVADDRPNPTLPFNGAGIQRFDRAGSTWALTYTIPLDAAGMVGARGLAVDWSAANATLYASTTDGRVVRVQDLGVASAVTTLATAQSGTVFAGVELIPEPAGLPMTLLATLVLRWRRPSRDPRRPAVIAHVMPVGRAHDALGVRNQPGRSAPPP